MSTGFSDKIDMRGKFAAIDEQMHQTGKTQCSFGIRASLERKFRNTETLWSSTSIKWPYQGSRISSFRKKLLRSEDVSMSELRVIV